MSLPTTTRILIFFARNPRERLTARDLEAKFGIRKSGAANLLADHREEGNIAVTDDRGRHGELVYCIGPALLREIGGGAVEGDAP